MRRIGILTCLVLAAVICSGCIWQDVVVIAEPSIRSGVAYGIEQANTDMELGLEPAVRAVLSEAVADKVIAELKKIGVEETG